MSCKSDALDARAAKTIIEVVERFSDHTLVRAKPLSGRLHQIRVHLAEIGYPVIADDCYEAFGRLKPPPELRETHSKPRTVESDDEEIDDNDEDELDDVEIDLTINDNALMSRHALHASQLGFQHPILYEWMTFTAPLPDDMLKTLERLHY